MENKTPTPDTLKPVLQLANFLIGKWHGTTMREISVADLRVLSEAATSAINLQERVKEMEGAILSAENTLDAARKTFNFYVEEHRKKGSAYDKIKRNEDIRDLCDETLSNLAAVRKKS